MKTFSRAIIPALLILLFTYASASKLLDVSRFRAQLHLQPFSPAFADLLVYALPAAELAAVSLLIFEGTRMAGMVLSATLMAGFTAYISFLLLSYQGKLPCSCGGILNHMSWTTHLVFNWAFFICTIIGILLYKNKDNVTI